MRSKQITMRMFVLACLVLFATSTAQAAITFVDAWTDNTTLDGAALEEDVNYTTSGGQGALDGLWHFRTRVTVNGGGIWSSDTGGQENTEPLVTTFTIPTPGTYDVYGLFWNNANGDGNFDCAFSVGSDCSYTNYNKNNATTASASDFGGTVIVTDGSLCMFKAVIGQVTTTTANESVSVYVQGLAGPWPELDERTWYDGVGYQASVIYWDGSVDSDWNNGSNWDTEAVPGPANHSIVQNTSVYPMIDSNVPDNYIFTIAWSGNSEGGVTITDGGSLTVTCFTRLGRAGGVGTLNICGGTLVTNILQVGYDGTGKINLSSGVLDVASLSFDTGNIDIHNGTLILNGDKVSEVEGWIDSGEITAYCDCGMVEYDYDESNPSKTTVTGFIQPATPLFSYPGWQIYDSPGGGQYRYGPSIIINSDKSIDMWYSATGNYSSEWDWIKHKKSYDGGHTWSSETIALRPTPGSLDHYSTCDSGVFYHGGYYYIGYTSTTVSNGTENDVFVARSIYPTCSYQKWNGSGWGGNPQPFIVYDGPSGAYGCGEPSFVVLDDTLYIYYSYVPSQRETRVCTAPVNNPNWPGNITHHGKALGPCWQDSVDVKYVDGMGKFIGIAVGKQMQSDSYINVWESYDGLTFNLSNELTDYIQPYCHNSGISGRCDGHIKLGSDNFIAYAYGPNWGNWDVFLTPIHFNELIAVKKYNTGSNKTETHVMSGLDNFSSYILQIGTAIGETDSDWQFISSDWDDDTKADLFAIRKVGGDSNKTEVSILDGATNYQYYLLEEAVTPMGGINPDKWKFDLADWDGDGVQDLFAIKNLSGSYKIEVHIMDGVNNFGSWLLRVETVLTPGSSQWDFEASDYNDDGVIDLFCIKKTGTGSGQTEVHILNGAGATAFQNYLLHAASTLDETDLSWVFEVTDWDNDDYADIIAITKSGESNHVEVHVLDGSGHFHSYLLNTATKLSAVGDNFELLISSVEE